MKATVEQLTAISVFAHLQPDQLTSLQPYTVVQTYQVGEIVNHEGDRLPARLYALIQGLLRVSKTAASGKETILRTLTSGDIFAAPALFGNGIAPATLTVEKEAQVLMVDRDALLAVIQANPEIALKMMAVFNQRLQQLHEAVHGLVSERAIVRVARLLQQAAMEPESRPDGETICLRQPLAYYEIARSVGITYEECVRLFKQLHAVVSYSRGGQITILDWDGLEAIAHDELEPDSAKPQSSKPQSSKPQSSKLEKAKPEKASRKR
ncbi:MAG TPA: Crp/Fnr family transcriptional regulator [Allocoleopsis sp.]